MTKTNLMKMAIFVVLILVVVGSYGGCFSSGGGDNSGFLQPEVRQSSNGILQTTIEIFISTNTILNPDTQEMDIVQTPTYEGALTGPTLRVKPGDSIQIEMINNLPPNPANQRGGGSLRLLTALLK